MIPYFLLLGCRGSKEEEKSLIGFVNCLGLENAILYVPPNLTNIQIKLQEYNLFQQSVYDYNAIRSIISNLYVQLFPNIWNELMYKKYLDFTITHRTCGLYLRCSQNNKDCSIYYSRDKISSQVIKTCNPLLMFKTKP